MSRTPAEADAERRRAGGASTEAARATPARRRSSAANGGRIAWVAAATALAAACGAALGSALVGGERPAQARPPASQIGLASGPARLPLPDGWRPLRRPSSLPGLDEATEVQGRRSTLALDIRAPEHPSLLPAGVVDTFADTPPAPRLARFGTRLAWSYELPAVEPSGHAVALTLPTSEGVVTFACQAVALRSALAECSQAMAALQLDGAAPLAPAPETAARIVLPATIGRLSRERRNARRALAATRAPARRRATALRVARAYAAAADRLRPLAAGAALGLTAALDELARAHRELAGASARRAMRAARRAGNTIERGERRLEPKLARVTSPPAQE